MLRGPLQRGSPPGLRPRPAMCLSRLRDNLPARRFRLPLQDSHCDEARRHKNGQIRKADDTNRYLLCPIHRSCTHRFSVSLLRAHVFRRVDAHMDEGHVQEAVFDTVSARQGAG